MKQIDTFMKIFSACTRYMYVKFMGYMIHYTEIENKYSENDFIYSRNRGFNKI